MTFKYWSWRSPDLAFDDVDRKAKYLFSEIDGEKTREVGPDSPGGGNAATASAVRFCGLSVLAVHVAAPTLLLSETKVDLLAEAAAGADLFTEALPR